METLRDKTSGEVSVCGFSIDQNPSEIKKCIGVQLQAAGYYPSLTLLELIDLFANPKFLDNSFVWISNAFMYESSIFQMGWEKCKLAHYNLISLNKTCTITET